MSDKEIMTPGEPNQDAATSDAAPEEGLNTGFFFDDRLKSTGVVRKADQQTNETAAQPDTTQIQASEETDLDDSGVSCCLQDTAISGAIPEEQPGSFFKDMLNSIGIARKAAQGSNETAAQPDTTQIYAAEMDSDDAGDSCCSIEVSQEILLRKPGKRPLLIIFAALVLLTIAGFLVGPRLLEPIPPGVDVVASYNGKMITIEALQSFLRLEGAKEISHAICEDHGLDHEKCNETEECETHPVHSLEGYQQTVKRMVMEQIVQDWATEQGFTKLEEVKHGLKDLLDGANVEMMIKQLHETEITPESIPKSEVQRYFDENRGTYQGRAFSEVEDEIRNILVSQKDETFFEEYIEKLKQSAGLEVNFDLLKVSEPTEEAILAYYQTKMASEEQSKSLSNVRSSIREILLQENMEREYTLRKDESLFHVHGRRYTLGEFYTEFKEFSTEYQKEYSTFEKKKDLLEQFIAKELLLEETADSDINEYDQHGFEELRVEYLYQMIHQQEVDGKLTEPTAEEIKAFYDKNKEYFFIPAGAKVSMIWIDMGLEGEKAESARQKAQEALSLIKGGMAFDEVAAKYSEDGTAQNGGLIDEWLYEGQLPEPLGAILSLQVDQVSNIIENQNGLYIFKLMERSEPEQKNPEEVSDTIKAHLSEIKHEQMMAEMENALLEKANFKIFNRTIRRLLQEQL